MWDACVCCFFFQAEDGIRDLVRSRGLGDVYKRQGHERFDTAQVEQRVPTVGLLHDAGDDAALAARILLSLIHI